MPSHGTVRLRDIWAMLEVCCTLGPFEVKEGKHAYRITYNDKVYPSLPLGPHGKRTGRTEIEVGHVKKMARELGILDCAKEQLEQLRT